MEKDDRPPWFSRDALTIPCSAPATPRAFRLAVAFLAAASSSGAAAVQEESGPFRAPWRMQDVAAATCVAAGDFDGDGRWDVASVHGQGKSVVGHTRVLVHASAIDGAAGV